ncbi:MAG: hypothetical protein U0798_12125 [Gemmataceae bacterium]
MNVTRRFSFKAGLKFCVRTVKQPRFGDQLIGDPLDDRGIFVHHGVENEMEQIIRPATDATVVPRGVRPDLIDTTQWGIMVRNQQRGRQDGGRLRPVAGIESAFGRL